MKAIYTKIAGKYYKIKQKTNIPTAVTAKIPGATSSVNTDSYNRVVTQTISINTLKHPGTKTNRENVDNMKKELLDQQITEIIEIPNKYKAHIDYSVFVDGREIDHNIQIKPVKHEDMVILLGIGTNDEDVFRRVKRFNDKIELRMTNRVPYGLMHNKKEDLSIKVHEISIYQEMIENDDNIHQSVYETPFTINSGIVRSELRDAKMIYSSSESGIEFEDLRIPFSPNRVEIDFGIILTDYNVVYDDTSINDILQYNIEQKYNPEPPNPPDEPNPPIIIPDGENKPIADGEYTPDEDGYYNYYERCQESTPYSLLVVEDLISDGVYDVDKMIRKNMVIQDIPDIEVGEYVIYRECIEYDF